MRFWNLKIVNIQALLQLNTPFQLLAVVIYAFRLWPAVRRVSWFDSGPARFIAIAALFVVVDIGLLVFLIVSLLSGAYGPMQEDITLLKIPVWLIFALDHAIFIGVMSNAIIALLLELTAGRGPRSRRVEDLLFWGTNLGLVGFIAGLALEQPILKQVFSPIMGVSLLVGLGVLAMRLFATPDRSAPGAR